MVDPRGLLMIEPTQPPSLPIVDALTRRVAGALRTAQLGETWRGWHTCSCGARSDNRDHCVQLVDGTWVLTNSLAVHYVARHRPEVPRADIDRIMKLASASVEPTAKEIG